MKIEVIRPISEAEVIRNLRKVRLAGFKQPLVYSSSAIGFNPLGEYPTPCQRYVLLNQLDRVRAIRNVIGEEAYAAFPGHIIRVDDGPELPFLWPIIEAYQGAWCDESIIMDGMHRYYDAQHRGLPNPVIIIYGPQFPYYARPNPNGWRDVQVLKTFPDGFVKREPIATNYRDYYRDLNAVFPGIQEKR